MAGTPAPSPAEVERALKRLTAGQFSQVCSEIGLLEVTLPGASQAAKASALVAMTRGRSDFTALVRAINRVDPKIWRVIPARSSVSSLVYGVIGFVVIAGIGVLVLVVVLSGGEQALQAPPTPTQTLAPTRTSVPTFTHTPTSTPLPTNTPTPTPTEIPTRAPRATALSGPTATLTSTPPPPVSIIYPAAQSQQPRSGYQAYPSETVEFRWLLRGVTLASDERYWMRLYTADGSIADNYLTSDTWRYYAVPSGATGSFTWTVTVVKVDTAGSLIGSLSPEGDPWVLAIK
jgi:hypothetical protein